MNFMSFLSCCVRVRIFIVDLFLGFGNGSFVWASITLAFRRQCGQERSVLVVQGMWML